MVGPLGVRSIDASALPSADLPSLSRNVFATRSSPYLTRNETVGDSVFRSDLAMNSPVVPSQSVPRRRSASPRKMNARLGMPQTGNLEFAEPPSVTRFAPQYVSLQEAAQRAQDPFR